MEKQQLDPALIKSFPGIGISLGAGVGIAVGVSIAGGLGVAVGAVIGAGLGLVAGAIARSLAEPRQ